MLIKENVSLKPYNTFGVEAIAKYFAVASNQDEVREILNWTKENNQKILLLSGGSNMLIVNDWDGLALKIEMHGIEIVESNEDEAIVKVNSAEVWNDFVQWCIERDLGGLENLSLIPGRAGTAPIQNIGAYGVEIKDTMTELTALEIATGQLRTFTNEQCKFGYRDSVFKNELKGQYLILDVSFKLTKKNHKLHTEYGAIRNELAQMGIENPTIKDVAQAVIKIRQSKLPDPKKIGNSGSFFKNPIIDQKLFNELKLKFPKIVGYPSGDDKVKVAAGWLIENAGWKGKRFGDAGVHKDQALVLVNHGNATGKEIYDLSEKIIQDIFEKYNIQLEREVNVI